MNDLIKGLIFPFIVDGKEEIIIDEDNKIPRCMAFEVRIWGDMLFYGIVYSVIVRIFHPQIQEGLIWYIIMVSTFWFSALMGIAFRYSRINKKV